MVRRIRDSAVALAICLLFALSLRNSFLLETYFHSASTEKEHGPSLQQQPLSSPRKIAILSGYVNKDEAKSRLPDHYHPHLLSKVCYAHLHNYHFIFNTSWGFLTERPRNDSTSNNNDRLHHLDSGTWQIVPYMEAALAHDKYDWVLWTDSDYVFQRMDVSIDKMIDAWETATGNDNVHVLVSPSLGADDDPQYIFQSWAVLIRNSPFGHRVLHHWRRFALGLCPQGNFKQKRYTWRISDQPGLWYALLKTHMEYFDDDHNKTTSATSNAERLNASTTSSLNLRLGCDPKTGYLQVNDDPSPFSREMYTYFRHAFQNRSHSMDNLTDFPSDQPILWSSSESNFLKRDNSNGNGTSASSSRHFTMGLGIDVEGQVGFWRYQPGVTPIPEFPSAFALHVKRALSPNLMRNLETCQKQYHCVAGYFNQSGSQSNETRLLLAKCGNESNRVYY